MSEYDSNPTFFKKYSEIARSTKGLQGAAEWHELEKMMPDFKGKRVLDLGCGYGWHCKYATDHGASSVTGVDGSQNMIKKAKENNNAPQIQYHVKLMQDVDFPKDSFDVVISSLAIHYMDSFDVVCGVVSKSLVDEGDVVFSVENPIFTSYGTGDWHYDEKGEPIHWPLDNYFNEGKRKANFLGEEVVKYHKSMSTYVNTLIQHGFTITKLVEPVPDKDIIHNDKENESRRPMMLLIAAKKRRVN